MLSEGNMEKTLKSELTSGLENRFRNHIEGIIPDLCELDRGCDPTEEDFESVLDYALDTSWGLMPRVPDDERRAMCVRVAKYFTGGGAWHG